MLNLLKKLYFLPCLLVAFVSMAAAAVEEYPLFNTLEGFTYHPEMSKSTQFDTYTFKTGKTPSDKVTVEGKFFDLHYKLNKGIEAPGGLLVIRNFTNSVRQTGGEVLDESRDSAVMRIIQGNKEIWVRVNCAANGGWYSLNIIEKSSMKQEVAVNPLLGAIDGTGKATVYINFDAASSQLKPDAESVMKDIFTMLSQRSNLKLSIDGHTDGDGTMERNQQLSSERAQTVKNTLIAKGIDPSRLVVKGYGMSMPIADNTTEAGKAKNRRVELVKID